MIKDEKLSEIMNEINENLKLNNFRDACSLAKVANDISPNNFQILLIIATCYQQMDNVNSAIEFYKLSIKSNGKFITSYDMLIDLLIKESSNNKYFIEESIFYIESVNKIDPDNFDRMFKYGSMTLLARDFNKAEIIFKDLTLRDSLNISYQYKLAETFSKTGKGLKAISLINTFFLFTKKKYLNLMEQLALAYFSLGELSKAKKEFYKILSDRNITDPKNTDIRENSYCNLCEVFRESSKKEEYPEFKKICNEGISLYPENIFLKKQSLYLDMYSNNESECRKKINFLCEKYPENREYAGLNLYLNHEYKSIELSGFCSNPFEAIRTYKLSDFYNNSNSKILSLINSIKKLPMLVDQPFKTDIGAKRTQTNLFQIKDSHLIGLSEKIFNILDIYKKDISNEVSGNYLNKWPNNLFLDAWSMIAEKDAFHIAHNHIESWVSGVIYLDIPNNLNNNDGSISFTTTPDKLPNKERPFEKIFKPNPGDIIMFPSHLYHYTFPHNDSNERICLPFNAVKSLK